MDHGPTIDDTVALALVHRLCSDGTAHALRVKYGLSLKDVGLTIGGAESTIYRWEQGERVPRSGPRVVAYASLLGRLLDLESARA